MPEAAPGRLAAKARWEPRARRRARGRRPRLPDPPCRALRQILTVQIRQAQLSPGQCQVWPPTRRLPHLGRPMLRRPSRVPRPTRPLPRPTRPPDRQPPEQLRLPTRKLLLKAVQRQLRRNCRPGDSNGTRGSTRLSRCVSENFGLFGSRRLFMPSPSSAVRCAAFRLPSLVPRVLQFVSRFAGTLVLAAHPPQSSDTSCDTFSSSYALPTKS